MTKTVFLEELAAELKRRKVADAAEILEEYQQHFAFKLADGYCEEEIAAKLGDPKAIAAQYDAVPSENRPGKVAVTALGLGITDFFFAIFCVLLFSWEIVMGALVVSFGALSACLMGDLGRLEHVFVPEMPYLCALVLGIAFAALTVLAAVAAVYFFGFVRQLMRSFGRFHRNTLAASCGRAPLPSVTVYPQFSAKTKRRFKKTALLAGTIFGVCFIVGFIACVICAGSFEFWHVWGWFGYAG